MKIAVFSDVHGNLPALEVFLESVINEVDGFLCLGDMVNYGPWGNECLDCIQSLPNLFYVKGNHEELYLDESLLINECELVRAFYRTTVERFTRYSLISNLDTEISVSRFKALHTISGLSIYPNSTLTLDANYLVGHTHHQFILSNNGKVLINPGSIGQNRGFINLVEFALLDTSTGIVEFRKVGYPIKFILDEMANKNYPEECIDYYKNKKRSSLDYHSHIVNLCFNL